MASERDKKPRDYSRAELEALDVLGGGTLCGGWFSFVVDAVDDYFRATNPEPAARIDAANKRARRLARACRQLHERGLVEKGRHPIDARCVAYRLIPMLRTSASAEHQSEQGDCHG